jgi:LmbE family N-acetylglucosaminyl deacetylase
VKECIFLGYPDGFTVADNDLVNQIVRLLRRYRPDVVITWDGYRGTFNHRDHRNCGIAVADALYPATRDRLYYHHLERDEGLGQHPVNEVLLFGSSEPDYTVDITDHWETKVDAILCHASQIGDRTREDFVKQRKEMEKRTGQSRIEEKFRRWSIRRPDPKDTKEEEAEKAAESEPQEAAREQDPVVAVPETAGWKPQRSE